MSLENDIEVTLLRKLFKMRCWDKHHICESNLPKGFPKHLYKKVMKVADDLRKRSLLVKHPTHHENQWHLNWNKKEEIERLIRD